MGGYDAIAAVADDLVSRLMADDQLGRFWANRGEDGMRREKQLVIDFPCARAGGPMYYTGRDMATSQENMKISTSDWHICIGDIEACLESFQVLDREREEVLAFIDSTRADIVGA